MMYYLLFNKTEMKYFMNSIVITKKIYLKFKENAKKFFHLPYRNLRCSTAKWLAGQT